MRKIVILYDLDQTGVTQATKVAAKLNGFQRVHLLLASGFLKGCWWKGCF